MPNKHAYLSASSAYRWMRCTRSPDMCADMEERSSPFAKEGSDAHTLCEHKVNVALGRDSPDPRENLEYYDQEMEECSDEYRNFVLEQVEEAKKQCTDPLVFIEERLDFSKWVPEAFGTGDCVIVSDGTLTIIDYKHGVGVLVDANDNPQMRCYALGALDTYGNLYDIKTIRMCIFQPRRDNVSISEISVDELLTWGETELKPKAEMAYKGEGNLVPGDHCIFCNARAVCRARAEYNLQMSDYDLEIPDKLEDAEIAVILGKIDELTAWASDVKEYALSKALSGTKFPGFKVVEGRSVRKYSDEEAVAETVTNAGFDPYEKKVMGITAMTKLLGKKRFEELIGSLVIKPPGKPVLAPESDKREELANVNDVFDEE